MNTAEGPSTPDGTLLDGGRALHVGLLETLTAVMASAKGYLGDHAPRVAVLANRLGIELGLSSGECSELVFASTLADMGMIGLAEDAWENPKPELSADVRRRVRQHPRRSEERVQEIPHLRDLAGLVRAHHEWWNGEGYPEGLSGDSIPLAARIIRLADTVTALAAPRPHRGPLTRSQIEAYVQEQAGGEFGPDVARAFLSLSRADRIPSFDAEDYRNLVMGAAERILPPEVEAPSTNQLLTIVANLVDAKDPYTAGHSRRVAVLALAAADQLGVDGALKSTLWSAGYLHDLGKVAVPLRVLAKDGSLTDEEFSFIKAHPGDGADILETIPPLRHLTDGVRHHHERWDGRGYPQGLAGDEIPLEAQIMAVCDTYDAMTSTRAYRSSVTSEYALAEIKRVRGSQFNPEVADAFLAIPDDIFAGLHDSRPEAFKEIPERVATLRLIDPRWFTSGDPGSTAKASGRNA
ncbi:MAG: HD domain-containing phosphohydrolase [Longimicrobiales bacterium]|nr:HD domain-containing phosphohydrolase [Longimicrobiales bacterium]